MRDFLAEDLDSRLDSSGIQPGSGHRKGMNGVTPFTGRYGRMLAGCGAIRPRRAFCTTTDASDRLLEIVRKDPTALDSALAKCDPDLRRRLLGPLAETLKKVRTHTLLPNRSVSRPPHVLVQDMLNEMHHADADRDGHVTPAELRMWFRRRCIITAT